MWGYKTIGYFTWMHTSAMKLEWTYVCICYALTPCTDSQYAKAGFILVELSLA